MSTQHTPEPWESQTDLDGDTYIQTASPMEATVSRPVRTTRLCKPIVAKLFQHTDNDSFSGAANARRIVACVNACAGLTDAELEDYGTGGILEWMTEADERLKAVGAALEDFDYSGYYEAGINALKQQRDELAAKLTDVELRCVKICGQRDELQAKCDGLAKALRDIDNGVGHPRTVARQAVAKAQADKWADGNPKCEWCIENNSLHCNDSCAKAHGVQS